MISQPARRVVRGWAVGSSRRAPCPGGTGTIDSAGRGRRLPPLLLTLLLFGLLVVGVPILVLARVPAAHADPWAGASEQPASDPTGEVRGDLTGGEATGSPEPAPWDAEAAALQQLRNRDAASQPAPAADDTLRTAALINAPPTPDRQGRGGVPLTTPNLGHLRRDPQTPNEPLQAAEVDGNGNGRRNGDPRPPGSPGQTDQTPAPTWTVTLRLELIDRTALHPTNPDPTLADQPGHPDPTPTASPSNPAPATPTRDHPRQPLAVATGWQPDQNRQTPSPVIADHDPPSPISSTWLHVATGDLPASTGRRSHPGGQLPDLSSAPAASSAAVGRPLATAPLVQLPAQPRPVPGSPPPVTADAQAPSFQLAHAIPVGRFGPASDGFPPSLPQATIVVTAAPTPVGTQVTAAANAAGKPGEPAQSGTTQLTLNIADLDGGSLTGRLPTNSFVLVLPNGSQVLLADDTPLIAPLSAGAAPLLAADVHTSRILQAGIGGWDGQGWEYLAAAGLFIGVLALGMSGITAAGAALGAIMLGTALMTASAIITWEKYTTGKVNWLEVAAWSAIGAVGGGLFYSLDFVLAGTAFWRWFTLGAAGRADHLAGEARPSRLPGGWWWWPRYQTSIRNYEQPGTIDWWETEVHEGVHALVSRYAGPVRWLGGRKLGPVPVGAPVFYTEEVVARAVGYAAVGRLHGVPLAPFMAFSSLTLGESVTTVVMGATGVVVYNATRKEPPR